MAVTENTTTTGTVSITTRTGTATAQKSPAGSPGDAIHAAGTVPVDELEVTTDKFVLNPSSPDAVKGHQAGGPGRSPLEDDGLPISRLSQGVPSFDDDETP